LLVFSIYNLNFSLIKINNNVRESFSEYKKTLESNLLNISYLYDGDIISSIDSDFTEIKTTPLTSPTFIVNTIINIYNQSIDKMFKKSIEYVIPKESITEKNIFDRLLELKIDPVYIFCSDKSKKLFSGSKSSSSTSAFPNYFYRLDKYIGLNVDLFYCPLISEEEDESIFYITDSSIQSLVYGIQNMDYEIYTDNNSNSEWIHKMTYNLYDCMFNYYKIVVKNVSKIRQDKINSILND
jgi:hypothetical protein